MAAPEAGGVEGWVLFLAPRRIAVGRQLAHLEAAGARALLGEPSGRRARLIAERDREKARIATSRKILRRIDKELAALEREQRQLTGG
jgi:hypothetical protein